MDSKCLKESVLQIAGGDVEKEKAIYLLIDSVLLNQAKEIIAKLNKLKIPKSLGNNDAKDFFNGGVESSISVTRKTKGLRLLYGIE
jgi:hypothetical protein